MTGNIVPWWVMFDKMVPIDEKIGYHAHGLTIEAQNREGAIAIATINFGRQPDGCLALPFAAAPRLTELKKRGKLVNPTLCGSPYICQGIATCTNCNTRAARGETRVEGEWIDEIP